MRATAVWSFVFFSAIAAGADRPEVPLWSNGAPGSEGKTAREVDEPPNS